MAAVVGDCAGVVSVVVAVGGGERALSQSLHRVAAEESATADGFCAGGRLRCATSHAATQVAIRPLDNGRKDVSMRTKCCQN